MSNPRDLNDTSTLRFHSTRERQTLWRQWQTKKDKAWSDVELVHDTNINATLDWKQEETIFAPPTVYLNQLQNIHTAVVCGNVYKCAFFFKVVNILINTCNTFWYKNLAKIKDYKISIMFIPISVVLPSGFQEHHMAFIRLVMQLHRGLLEDLETTY